MRAFYKERYHSLRKDHGVITSFTLSVHPYAWFAGWGILGFIGGFVFA